MLGNPKRGLLKAIIDQFNELGPELCWDTGFITKRLKDKRYWPPGTAKTPERTVNTYCSQNPEVFAPATPNTYFLREAYWKNRE